MSKKNGTFKIQVKYEADSPSDLGGLTMTFDATIFTPVEKADYSRYIWIAIAVGVVALIVGVSISVCCYRRHKKPKTEDQKSKASKSKTNKSGNKSTSQQTPAPPPIIMNATKVRTERSAYQGDDDIVDSEYFIKRQFQEDVL
ncbi:hypothetical protein M3Y94_01019800 [Aphelenchoides besseyi]|nr:hypothetical protein M3Y94_01019800 [Aphelenchoides besseyi]